MYFAICRSAIEMNTCSIIIAASQFIFSLRLTRTLSFMGESVVARLPAHLSLNATVMSTTSPQAASGSAINLDEAKKATTMTTAGQHDHPGKDRTSVPQKLDRDHEPLPPRLHPRPSQRVLIPPPNFGMVEDALYRSGQPSELNFPFLEKLRLKAVVWLAPEDPGGRL
jgi:tyrosine-protein phosphatase OCA1